MASRGWMIRSFAWRLNQHMSPYNHNFMINLYDRIRMKVNLKSLKSKIKFLRSCLENHFVSGYIS